MLPKYGNAGVKVRKLMILETLVLVLVVSKTRPETLDWDEPEKVARSIKIMNIKHAVITSDQG
jgi:hypothetical protein